MDPKPNTEVEENPFQTDGLKTPTQEQKIERMEARMTEQLAKMASTGNLIN